MLNEKFKIGKTVGLTLMSSVIFFIFSNLGVWLFGNMYSLDMQGLIKCFVMAIPFNQYTWIGDLFFVFVLFGIYEYVSNKYFVDTKDIMWQKNDTLD